MGSQENTRKGVDVASERVPCPNCGMSVARDDLSCKHCGQMGTFENAPSAQYLRERAKARVQRAVTGSGTYGEISEGDLDSERELEWRKKSEYVIVHDPLYSGESKYFFLSQKGVEKLIEEMVQYPSSSEEQGTLETIENRIRLLETIATRILCIAIKARAIDADDLTRIFEDYFEHRAEVMEEKGLVAEVDLR